MNSLNKFSYGVGHILNDLTASMWFSYLLVYLNRVVNFSNSLSGYLMLLGQVADGISTVFVGFESDRTLSGFCNYGKRKSWHLFGVICVLVSFPFMFNLCIGCENSPEWTRFIYYAPFVFIFQFGWASTQISHLALIPQLSKCEIERASLNTTRYAFTVISNLFIYGVAYLFFKFNDSSNENQLSRKDASKFMYLSFIVCLVGLFFQLVFHVGVNERITLNDENVLTRKHRLVNRAKLNWYDYLKSYRFYMVALLYMNTRMVVNMSQVYFPLYLTDSLELDKSLIALIPFISFLIGFLATFPLRILKKKYGDYRTYSIGSALILTTCILLWRNNLISDTKTTSIFASIFLGCGNTVILCTSLSLTTDLIGSNSENGAFVFGAMSFTDKLSNGLAVAILQQFNPCENHVSSNGCRNYYHIIMSSIPAICSGISLLSLLLLYLNQKKEDLYLANPLFINQENEEMLVLTRIEH